MSESHADQIASTLEEAVPPRGEPHSAFSKRRKRYIIVLVAIAAVFSPLSSFIYYPAIQTLAGDLRVSIEKINLGITTYMVVSGVTPAFVGDLADQIGRRPVYLTTLGIYLLANVGLALQSNYAALLVLRALQSAGSSGTIAIAYGVISDVATPAERGSYVGAFQIGAMSTSPNVAPSFGPVIGAVLADLAGWRWIFWFLAICSGFVLCLLFLFLPETARKIVGNGAVSSKSILATKRFGRSESQPPATPG
ncbi:MAG: putative DNA helicase ino80, partial [Chaenotheca gracillima]